MNRGCVIFALLLAAGIGIAGYFAMQTFVRVPPELKAYDEIETAIEQVKNKGAAPARELTEADVQFFLGAADSVESGWRPFMGALVEATKRGKDGKDTADIDIQVGKKLLTEMNLVSPRSRRALVNFLNARDISWARYVWMKTRIAAAAGITPLVVDSTVSVRIRGYIGSDTAGPTLDHSESSIAFFRSVDSLVKSGSITPAERQLAATYRDRIITLGLTAFIGLEMESSVTLIKF